MALLRTTSQLRFLDLIRYPDLSIPEGAFCFITGPSGCGKSTYLRFLNRTLSAPPGTIFFEERPICDLPVLSYRRQVLLTPQSLYLMDASIRENFHFYYDSRQQPRPSDEEIRSFLSLCCLDTDPERACTGMSGGERQRVFLAIFLSLATRVLLLDEPTSALDDSTARQVLLNVRDYCRDKGVAVVCVCHDRRLADELGRERIEMGGGNLA